MKLCDLILQLYLQSFANKKASIKKIFVNALKWAHQDLNLGPPDYEKQKSTFHRFTHLYLDCLKHLPAKHYRQINFFKLTLLFVLLPIFVCKLFANFKGIFFMIIRKNNATHLDNFSLKRVINLFFYGNDKHFSGFA